MRFEKTFAAAWLSLLMFGGVARAQPSAVPPSAVPQPAVPSAVPSAPTAPAEPPPEVVVLPTIEATPVVSPPVVAAPAPAVFTAEALAAYRSQFIFLNEEEWLTLTAHRHGDHVWGSVTSNRVIHAKRGEQRESIDGADFYDAVGRPDLADSYRNRRNLSVGVGVAFGVLVVFGGYEIANSISIREGTFDNDNCVLGDNFEACVAADQIADQKLEDEADSHLRRGLIGAGVGIVAGIVSAAIYKKRHPVSDDERRFLVTKYNRSLRERLGIPEPRILDVGPYAAGGGGGGVLVTGQF